MVVSERPAWCRALSIAAVAGASIMMVEVAAGRLISRFLGQSLYTWTSVIGVVLAGLSLGNYLGGRAADRVAPSRLLMTLLWLAALGCWSIPPLNEWVGRREVLLQFSWPARIFLHTACVFFLPSALLGGIGPVTARLALEAGRRPGHALGAVYAAGALGSIAGTFLAGYWLIAAVGTSRLIVLVGVGLAAMAVVARFARVHLALMLVVAGASCAMALVPHPAVVKVAERLGWRESLGSRILFRKESHYQMITVKQMSDNLAHRGLYLDKMLHSEAVVGEPTRLLYRYAWVYEALLDRAFPPPAPIRALVIGGGAYTFPAYLAATRRGSYVAVAEIDPEVTEAAKQYFGFEPKDNIEVYHADARNVVADLLRQRAERGEKPAFDCIFGDTFNDYSVPYHLVTTEFTKQLADLLSERGFYLLNMIDRFDSGLFLGAVVNTFRAVFPEVRVFFCHANLAARGTYVVVGAKRSLDTVGLAEQIRRKHPEFYGFELDNRPLDELLARVGSAVLTDNHAPVENLLAPVVARDSPEGIDIVWVKRGLHEARGGRIAEAARWFQKAVDVNEACVSAWYNLGVARMQAGDANGALEAFNKALWWDPGYVDARNNRAVLFAQAGRLADARADIEEVLRLKPDSAIAHNNFGELLIAGGDVTGAVTHFRRAIELDPAFERARANLRRFESDRVR